MAVKTYQHRRTRVEAEQFRRGTVPTMMKGIQPVVLADLGEKVVNWQLAGENGELFQFKDETGWYAFLDEGDYLVRTKQGFIRMTREAFEEQYEEIPEA